MIIYLLLAWYVLSIITIYSLPCISCLTSTQGFFTTYSIFAALGVHHGTGRVLEDIPLYDIPKALHFWFLCE